MGARVDTKNFYSMTELRETPAAIIDEALTKTVVIVRNNRPLVAIISIEELARLQQIEQESTAALDEVVKLRGEMEQILHYANEPGFSAEYVSEKAKEIATKALE